MDKQEAATGGKIVLPASTQREMIKFFLKTSMLVPAAIDKEQQQTPVNPNEGRWSNC